MDAGEYGEDESPYRLSLPRLTRAADGPDATRPTARCEAAANLALQITCIRAFFPPKLIMVDLAEWVRTRAQRVKNPYQRTPDRETYHNNADNVERQLQEDGHKIWGWVIYRCTYENDREWEEFMARLRFYIRDTLEFDNGVDMLGSLDYHVFEDRTLFDNAHPSTIRDHFEEWTGTAPLREQGIEARQVERSQRYNFCLHVDQAAL
ncbi:hypothetical protein M8818_005080 [Zalaria obscura]|uniref:Uncharacterized protein n=1 Tax=Zalaria obscura TaxID=2024903 RepID=A0ACC3SA22_9PEZI